MASGKIPDSPVSLLRNRRGATDSSEAFSSAHAGKQRLQHGESRLADGNHEYLLEFLQCDPRRRQQRRDRPHKRVAFEPQVPVECGLNAASFKRAMKNLASVAV